MSNDSLVSVSRLTNEAEWSDDLVARRVSLIISQAKGGTISAVSLATMLGFLLVPAAGWGLYLVWYGALVGGFLSRGVYFDHLVKSQGPNRRSLLIIASISAFTGWVASLCLPIFSRFLSIVDVAVLSALMVGWVAFGIAVLSVSPKVYRIYLVACLANVFMGWLGQAGPRDLTVLGLGMVMGGVMLDRLAHLMWLQRDAIAQRERACTDMLTRLPNREGIRLDGDALFRRGGTPVVLVLDVNRFKAINDAMGYDFGDAVLVETGRRLSSIVGAQPGRLHASQFCLVSHDPGVGQKLRREIEDRFVEPVQVLGETVDVNFTIGEAVAGLHGQSMSELIRNAAVAANAAQRMQMAMMVYSEALSTVKRADLMLLSELKHAVDQNQLRLYLQPKVSTRDGRITSAEALVRWEHPVRGLVPPSDFIPFAEQTGSIRLLTRWILGNAMRLTAELAAQGERLQISVNISINDLRDERFVARTLEQANEIGASPADLRLEITESSVMDNPSAMLAELHALREAGFSLSIDDFGTGYSSLAYLQKMPVAELKIDRAFVRGVKAGSDGEKLLDSIAGLGHRLGLTVVAEGVETAEEWDLVARLGCDYVQGWFAAKAMPRDDFLAWRAANNPFKVPGAI